MTKVRPPRDPVAQFHKTVKEAKADSYIQRDGEADRIAQAAERAVEYAAERGDPTTRAKVLEQLEALSNLSPLYADPTAAGHLRQAYDRLRSGALVSSAAERVFGPRPEGRRTYIMSTIGHTSQSKETIGEMLKAGANVIRLNMAHRGPHTDEYIASTRAASVETSKPVRLIADLGGPKIRLGDWDREKIGAIDLQAGTKVDLKMNGQPASASLLPIDDQILVDSVKVGDRLLLVDGKIELKVTAKTQDTLSTEVVRGGQVAPNKGIALPDSRWLGDTITDKDKEDIGYCVRNGVEIIGISFCSSAEDVHQVRALARQAAIDAGFDMAKWTPPSVVAKIETRAGLENLDEIAAASDGMMVARGDLSTEIGWENVPAAQAEINRVGNVLGKPVIVATGLLPSMGTGTVPTQAEADAIWNAVQQGTEVVMTAKETTRGDHPAEVVRAAARALQAAEAGLSKGPLALRMKQVAAKPAPAALPDVRDRLAEPGQTFRGRISSVFPFHTDKGEAFVAVRKHGSDEQITLKVTGLDVGRRLSDDSWVDLLDATFKTHAPKQVSVTATSGEMPGDKGNWEDKPERLDLVVHGTVHVHKWTT